jgi:hypothetical protein
VGQQEDKEGVEILNWQLCEVYAVTTNRVIAFIYCCAH